MFFVVIYRANRIEVRFNYLGEGEHGFRVGHSDASAMRNSVLFVVGNEGARLLEGTEVGVFEDHAHNKN